MGYLYPYHLTRDGYGHDPKLQLTHQALGSTDTSDTVSHHTIKALIHQFNSYWWLSMAEAEYIALTTVAREILYLQLLVEELYESPTLPTPIYCNNQAAIALASNNKFQSQTKHINLRYHFICTHIKNSTFTLTYCPTDDNVADAFTKALPRPRLQKLHGLMSLDSTQGGVSKSGSKSEQEMSE